MNFDGLLQNNAAILNWSTATELNNKGFEVQKSMDGTTFTVIGFVKGHGNSHQVNNYTFSDLKLLSGSNYYRLKQIDNVGNFSYSSDIKLDFSRFDWAVLGNPVSNNSAVQLQLDKPSKVMIQMISIDGTIIQTINKGKISQGTYSIPLQVSNTNSGIYILKLMVDAKNYSKKI